MQNFQTTLRLARQPDGLYTLTATTIAPDSCHMAARPMRGTALGQIVPNDHVSVLLPVVSREPCTGSPATIRHVVPNLRLGKDGKLGVTAFVVANPDHGLLCATSVRLSPSRSGRLVPLQVSALVPAAPPPAPLPVLPIPARSARAAARRR